MTIITRPIKTGGGTDVVAGNDLLAQEWNGDINTMYTDYDGHITDANCDIAMGLQGTKLADAPLGVPTAKINDLAITTAKINDLAVTRGKINTLAVSLDKLGAVYQTKNATVNTGIAGTRPLVSVERITNAGNYEAVFQSINPVGTIIFQQLAPSIPIPVATKELIGLYLANIIYASPNTTFDIVFVSIDRT